MCLQASRYQRYTNSVLIIINITIVSLFLWVFFYFQGLLLSRCTRKNILTKGRMCDFINISYALKISNHPLQCNELHIRLSKFCQSDLPVLHGEVSSDGKTSVGW